MMRPVPLVVLALAAIATPALARADHYYVGGGALVTGGIGGVHFGELIGQPEDGRDDLTGRRGGVYLRGGAARGPFELGARAGIAIGGLSLQRMEEVYFDSEPQPLGGASVVDLAVELRFEQDVAARWVPFAGAAAGWERLSAASPAGAAWIDAFFGEIAAGLSWPLGPTPLFGGRVDVGVMLRISGAYRAYMNGELSTPSRIRYFGSPGVTAQYAYRF